VAGTGSRSVTENETSKRKVELRNQALEVIETENLKLKKRLERLNFWGGFPGRRYN
jgi:hypothetical protein